MQVKDSPKTSSSLWTWKRAFSMIACLTTILMAVGCDGGSNEPKPVDPPSKPLSANETAMLEKVEALPLKDRPDFARSNYQGLMMMSRENKTFADKLNALLS